MSSFRNSAHWIPNIENMCRRFRKKSLSSDHLIYRENVFAPIDDYCDKMVVALKDEIYFNHPDARDCLLDHHKIIALYILGVLKNQPFEKELLTENDTYCDVLPNEHFCYILILAILFAWHKSNNRSVKIGIPKEYMDCLLLLFRKYKRSRSPQTDDVMFAYALSNIIYFIDTYFVKLS
jgi:hypothetical protein